MTTLLQIRTSTPGAGSPSYASSGTITGGGIRAGIESLIRLIDGVSEGTNFATSGTFTSDAPILNIRTRSVVREWRVNVRKLAMLARLQKGWDYPESQPLNRAAEANYLDWLTTIPSDRMDDAEPMLTDDGNIRLEWRRDGYVRIAEIGSDSLYLAVLAPHPANDEAADFDRYDSNALNRFFQEGVIRS